MSHILLTDHKTRVATETPGETGERRRRFAVLFAGFLVTLSWDGRRGRKTRPLAHTAQRARRVGGRQ